MWRRVPVLLVTALLALAVLVVAHDLVYLLQFGNGYAAALAQTGHGAAWDDTVRLVLGATGLLSVAAGARLLYLWTRLRRLRGSGQVHAISARAYAIALARLWVVLFATATALFVLQENVEHATSGLALPGLSVLSSSGVIGPLPVLGLISLSVAAVAALFRWTIAILEARIRAARRPRVRSGSARLQHSLDPIRPASSLLGRNLAGRAPPVDLSA